MEVLEVLDENMTLAEALARVEELSRLYDLELMLDIANCAIMTADEGISNVQ